MNDHSTSAGAGGAGGMPTGDGGAGAVGGAGGAPNAEPPTTSMLLEVLTSANTPIASAAVTMKGVTQPTNGAGYIHFAPLTPSRFAAKVESWGYAPASAVAKLPANVQGGLQVHLIPLGDPIPFDAADGAVLDRGPVRLTIPPNALVDHNGEPVKGIVEATIVPFDLANDIDNVPAPLEGMEKEADTHVGLDSLAMAHVALWQNGLQVQPADGRTATLEVQIPANLGPNYPVGSGLPAWRLDLDDGVWREDGGGTIMNSATTPGKLAWVAKIGHFAWWNGGKTWTSTDCFDVLVTDSHGAPVPNMLVGAKWTNFTRVPVPVFTKPTGHACITSKRGAELTLFAGPQGSPLVSSDVTGEDTGASCEDNKPCASTTLKVPDEIVCNPGFTQPCSPPGFPEAGTGICMGNTDYCNVTGTAWTGCTGQVTPVAENCNSPFDDDCDGIANEDGTGCNCEPGSSSTCYSGPVETQNVGICTDGTHTCGTDGKSFTPCVGQVLPVTETCSTAADDDCNGSTSCAYWSKQLDNDGTASIYATAVDSVGNVLVGGVFKGKVNIGDASLTSNGGSDDIFIAKYNSDGTFVWVQQFGDATAQRVNAIAVALDGSVVVTGEFNGTIDFGNNNPLTSAGGTDIFIAKLDPNSGVASWREGFGSTVDDGGASVTVDSQGNVLLTGHFEGSVDFGGGPLASSGVDAFLVQLDSNGNHVWSKKFGNLNWQYGKAVAVDAWNNVLLAGTFLGTVDFGNGPLVSAGDNDIFVAKFNSAGVPQWSKGFGDAYRQTVTSVAADASGNVVLAGDFQGTLDFGDGALSSAGQQDMFIAKLASSDGSPLWSRSFGDAGSQWLYSMDVDGSGNIVAAGAFEGTVDFGNGALPSAGLRDIFVAVFNGNGQSLWSKGFGDTANQYGRATAFAGNGDVVLAGSFTGTVDFSKGPLTCEGSDDAFVVKLSP